MAYIDIDVDDFLSSCSSRDIKELIQGLVDDKHLPKEVLKVKDDIVSRGRGRGEEDFAIKIEKLKTRYYSLTQEEEEFFDKIFKKYL